ncbi:RICIN domain-containing protein [Streptomyces syringium]|uniref:RICIN domain-containing protein n=1 Tax=Streptomyces syringium TaxID=76729 RepID=UPI0033C84BF8
MTGRPPGVQVPDIERFGPLCLDIPRGNTKNGTQLQLWTCNGRISQQFQMSCASANETKCRIAPYGASFRKCLSVKAGRRPTTRPWSFGTATAPRIKASGSVRPDGSVRAEGARRVRQSSNQARHVSMPGFHLFNQKAEQHLALSEPFSC